MFGGISNCSNAWKMEKNKQKKTILSLIAYLYILIDLVIKPQSADLQTSRVETI